VRAKHQEATTERIAEALAKRYETVKEWTGRFELPVPPEWPNEETNVGLDGGAVVDPEGRLEPEERQRRARAARRAHMTAMADRSCEARRRRAERQRQDS
jgi:hypothetical protein